MVALRYIIENNITITSSLIIDAFNIASEVHDYEEAIKLINKARKQHKDNIARRKIFF